MNTIGASTGTSAGHEADRFVHGGPDALGLPLHDFSTNSNACGPCPIALEAVRNADGAQYPDPHYTALRERLAALHRVHRDRIVLAASASEFIARITAWTAAEKRHAGAEDASVWLPPLHYGDYARAALAWKLGIASEPERSRLLWCCEPSSPLGQNQHGLPELVEQLRPDQLAVLDCAYLPLRLEGRSGLDAAARNRLWQMWSPNKALGLTGVRGAYVIAPPGSSAVREGLLSMAPSWPLGAHGVAMLHAWCEAPVRQWLARSLDTLREWKSRQQAICSDLGWDVLPSTANYFCARLPAAAWLGESPSALPAQLRALHDIKLRDTSSFGLPAHVRLGVLPPAAQDALRLAVLAVLASKGVSDAGNA